MYNYLTNDLSSVQSALVCYYNKWCKNWPFIADFESMPRDHYQFIKSELLRNSEDQESIRKAIQEFVEKMDLNLNDSPERNAAYLCLFTHLGLMFRYPIVNRNAEELEREPVVSERQIGFPPDLSKYWDEAAHQLGIAPGVTLTSYVYANYYCDIEDFPFLEDPFEESENFESYVMHQRHRLESSRMHFVRYQDQEDLAILHHFNKVLIYSEIAGKRVYHWIMMSLNCLLNDHDEAKAIACLRLAVRWSIEVFHQHMETGDLPREALALAHLSTKIKLEGRPETPSVTGFFPPFLDEFFGFTTQSSSYLEVVRQSRAYILKEAADLLNVCQMTSPYPKVLDLLSADGKEQVEILRSDLLTVMQAWRKFHRRQIVQFMASNIDEAPVDSLTKVRVATVGRKLSERIHSFEREPLLLAKSVESG